jgi:hypothetical protein
MNKELLISLAKRSTQAGYYVDTSSLGNHVWWQDSMIGQVPMAPQLPRIQLNGFTHKHLIGLLVTANVSVGLRAYLGILIMMGATTYALDPANMAEALITDYVQDADEIDRSAYMVSMNVVDNIMVQYSTLDPAARNYEYLRVATPASPLLEYVERLEQSLGVNYATAWVGFFCLYLTKSVVKTVDHIQTIPEKVSRNFTSLYKVNVEPCDLSLDVAVLNSIMRTMSSKNPTVMSYLRSIITSWVMYKDLNQEGIQGKGALEATIVQSLSLIGLPVLGMAQQMLLAVNASLGEVWNSTSGLITDRGQYMALATWVVYLISDIQTRGTLIANYQIQNPPPIGLQWWRFARLFDNTMMLGLSGDGADETLYLYAALHDKVWTDRQIIPGYRVLHPKYTMESLNAVVDAVINIFNSITRVPADHQGAAIREAIRMMNTSVGNQQRGPLRANVAVPALEPPAQGVVAVQPGLVPGAAAAVVVAPAQAADDGMVIEEI